MLYKLWAKKFYFWSKKLVFMLILSRIIENCGANNEGSKYNGAVF